VIVGPPHHSYPTNLSPERVLGFRDWREKERRGREGRRKMSEGRRREEREERHTSQV
jgi:hypothetical protein